MMGHVPQRDEASRPTDLAPRSHCAWGPPPLPHRRDPQHPRSERRHSNVWSKATTAATTTTTATTKATATTKDYQQRINTYDYRKECHQRINTYDYRKECPTENQYI